MVSRAGGCRGRLGHSGACPRRDPTGFPRSFGRLQRCRTRPAVGLLAGIRCVPIHRRKWRSHFGGARQVSCRYLSPDLRCRRTLLHRRDRRLRSRPVANPGCCSFTAPTMLLAFHWTPKAWVCGLPMAISRADGKRAQPAPPCALSTTARKWISTFVYPTNLGSAHRNPPKSRGCITTYWAGFLMYGPLSTLAAPAKPHCAISDIGRK